MAQFGITFGVLVGTALLCGLVSTWYWHRSRERDGDRTMPVAGAGAAVAADQRLEPGECRACGAENDPAFTFCRECVARLPELASTGGPGTPHVGDGLGGGE